MSELHRAFDVLEAMIHSPLQHYIAPGLTSYLVGGLEHGKVRMFHSDREQREFITPHSHRFNFACIVLSGYARNVIFEEVGRSAEETNTYACGTMQPAGEFGEYAFTPGDTPRHFREIAKTYKAGEFYSMQRGEIHSITFGKETAVLFLEGPEVIHESVVLEPWSSGGRVPTFATREWMFKKSAPIPGVSK